MANYIINDCLTNEEYIVSAITLTVGETVGYSIDEIGFCATVGVETSNPPTIGVTLGISYTDCCECLSETTVDLNFKFIRCGTLEEINIDPTEFCSYFGAPTSGSTYEIQFGRGTPFCVTFDGLTNSGETNYYYYSGPFLDCENCVSPPPISAGTETIMCELDCSGNTITVVPPHPTWTNAYGKAVVLLDAIELGGMNGLNS
jgi:hypothetical protein